MSVSHPEHRKHALTRARSLFGPRPPPGNRATSAGKKGCVWPHPHACSPSLLIFVTFLNADTEQQKRYCGRSRRHVTECKERGEDRKFVTYEADVTGVTCSLRVPRAARHCRLLHKHNHPVHPNPLCRIVYLTRCSFIVKREASRAILFVFCWFNFVL